ncbi:hypothetical protein BC833DRAFT_314094 [Globomyces pollinis-pini]|nr:hypothetical protein BC833DRAFT_314094 [Globomyces pollinis-pini]
MISRLPARVTTNRKSMLGLSNVSFTDNFSFGQDEPSLDGSEPSMTISQLQDLQTNKSESNIGILPPKPISTVELKSEPKPITGVELKSEPKPLISNKILLLDKQVKENLKLEDENGIPARRQSTSFTEDHAQNFHEKRNFFNTDMTSSINSTTDQNRFFSNMTLPDTNRLSITSENTSFSSDFILPDSDDLEKLQSVVSKLARKLKRRERELEKRDLECSNLNDQVESITKTNMMIKKELNDLNSKHDIILQTNETLEKKLNEFDQDVLIIKDLQKALGIVEEEKKSLIALHRTEIEDMNDKLKEMESRYENELKSLNVEQSKTNAEFESKIQMLKDMEVSSDDKNENQEREILDMKQDLQELYNRIQTLMDENELLKIQLIEFNHLSIPNDLGMTLDNNISISKNHQETQVDIQMIDSSHQTNPTKTKLVVSPLSIYEIQPDFEKYQQELNTLEYQITIRDDKFKQYEIENQNLKNQISILNHQLFNSEKEKNELIEENRFYEKTLMNKIKTIQDTITNDQQQLELVTNEMDDIKDGLIRNQKRMIQQQNINKEMDIWIDQTELGLVDIEKQRNDIINEMERYRNNNTQLKKQIYKSRKNQVELGLKSKTPVQALTDIPGVFYSTPVKPIRLLSASPISGDIVEPSFEVNSSLEPKIDSSTPTKKVIVRKDKIQWVNSIWIGCIVMFMIVYYNFVGSVWYGSFPRSTTSSPTFFSDVII